jgi:acetoin utilization deacetylase AcuC-like enzyme
MKQAALYLDPRFGDHHPAHAVRALHPDNHARYEALVAAAARWEEAFMRPPVGEFRTELAAEVHTPAYLDTLEGLRGVTSYAFDEDTSVSAGSVDASYAAAAALCHAVEASWSGEVPRAFVLARPPGHHAGPERAMGFCLLNHVAVAASHARRLGAQRVAIIDWDVHLGNGTQEIFEADADVLTVDLHQAEHWPGGGELESMGRGEGLGRTLNLPLPKGSGDSECLAVFDRIVAPAIDAFEPGLILVSAGFDAHRDDPLGELNFTSTGFAQLCARARALAERHAEGRLILNLEGGYDPTALQASTEACLEVLAAASVPTLAQPGPFSTSVQGLCERASEQFGLRAPPS